MPGYIEDRWFKKGPDGKRNIPTDRHGTGMRYKVAGIPGVRARSFPDKQLAAARVWLANAQAESSKGEFIDPRDGNITLRHYVEQHWWPSRAGDPSTLDSLSRRVRNQILPYLGSVPLRHLKPEHLRMWLKELEGVVSDGTKFVAWGNLKHILDCAVDDERILKNPCRARTVKTPPKPSSKARAWSRERVAAVRAALPAPYQVLVDIGVGAGLRHGEALGLSVDDIDLVAGVIHVRRQIRPVAGQLVFSLPKGNKTRTVPMPDYLAARIREHLAAHPPRSVTLPWKDPRPPQTKVEEKERAPQTHVLLVTNTKGGPIRANMWNHNHWKRALAKAGVIPAPKKRPRKSGGGSELIYGATNEYGYHCLRHTFASVLLDSRENPVAVSKWLGHADASITFKVYGHFLPDADGRGRMAMDNWLTEESASASSSPGTPHDADAALSAELSLPRNDPSLPGAENGESPFDLQEDAA
jgi:integrase